MSDRQKSKKKRELEKASMSPKEPPTKLQKAVTHWLRKNVPTKKTKFLHAHVVEYFSASKAIDALLNESPWARSKMDQDAIDKSELSFSTREQCIGYLDELLRHKMFHRAKKIPVAEKVSKKDKKDKKEKEKGTDEDEEKEDSSKPNAKGDKDKASATLTKKKRKIRLDMHLDQIVVDSSDAYVWLYDPVGWFYWAGGTAIVLGTIAICLFPLWPPMMRTGVHYLSMGAAGFLLAIMGIGVLKYIMFALLFALSAGKLSFWLFPNLTEDVGFMESFMPLYDYTYTGESFLGRRKKAKGSDDEESDDDEDEEDENADNEESDAATGEKRKKASAKKENDDSDDSSSKASSKTGKDFEMVEDTLQYVDTADEEQDQP